MKKTKWPDLKPESILNVDATPDEDYPLRILKAYRQNCNSRYKTHGLSKKDVKFWDMMNEWQDQRAKILDKAILKLLE